MEVVCNAGWMVAQGAFNEVQGHGHWELPKWYGAGAFAVGEAIGVAIDAALNQCLDESKSTLNWLTARSLNFIGKVWITNKLIEYHHPNWFKGIDGSEFVAARLTTLVTVLSIDAGLYLAGTDRQGVCSTLALQG